MDFSGSFDLEGIPPSEAWVTLSDPIAVRDALRGCRYITPMDDGFSFDTYEPDPDVATLPEADPEDVAARAFQEGQTYAAVMELGVGSVKPRFESQITVEERDADAHRMVATGRGNASNSTFQMEARMQITETDAGSRVDWEAHADISGRIAQLGGRVIKPVTNRVVNSFFNQIQSQMTAVEAADDEGLTSRIRNLL